ncbi:MAG TPA: prenyltransferase, partial [Actinomycetota bacterium]|nr:prenyltransferase [Actinomycetota bacterium]
AIPWWPGGRLDVWNHVESAMALDACGFAREAEAAYRWLAAIQRTDGAWCAAYVDGRPTDATLDANFVAYVAAGCHHHFLHTRDIDFLIEMWPTVERAIEFVLALQLPSGEIAWARDAAYRAWPAGLRTSSACIYLSLRSAIAIAGELGLAKPEWELAAESLRASVARGDREFIPKDNFSMDWYYPVLAGALRGEAARRRLNEGWATFVIEGRGVRCVSERPWVTAGESAELVIALSVAGYDERAELVFDWLQHLRTPTGSYWTGATWPDGTVWPREAPTWCAGAVILADASLNPRTPTHGLFEVSEEADVNLDAAQRLADPL